MGSSTRSQPVEDPDGSLRRAMLARLEYDLWTKPLTDRVDVTYAKPAGYKTKLASAATRERIRRMRHQ